MKRLLFLMFFAYSAIYAQPPQSYFIGVAADNPPFSVQSDEKNHFFGFEIDLMNEICTRLKIKCEYRSVIVSEIEPQILANKIDLSIAAIIIPSTPLNGLIFSLPYLQSGGRFMVLKDSKIYSPSDIKDKTIGVRRGTLGGGRIFEDLILQLYNKKIQVTEYISIDVLISALNNKEIDAIFTNTAIVRYWYYNNETRYKLIGPNIPVGNGYGIMSTPKYQALINQIDQAITQIIADGTYLRIYNSYFAW